MDNLASDAPASWTPLEVDTRKTLVSLGAGRASGVLSGMASAEINLSVPDLFIADVRTLQTVLNVEIAGEAVSVRQSFSSPFTGFATLVFLEKASEKLIKIMLGDAAAGMNPDLEAEALQEIGNIVLNSCLGAIADSLSTELKVELPTVLKGDASRILRVDEDEQGWELFLVRVNLTSQPVGMGDLIVLTLAPGQSDSFPRLICGLHAV